MFYVRYIFERVLKTMNIYNSFLFCTYVFNFSNSSWALILTLFNRLSSSSSYKVALVLKFQTKHKQNYPRAQQMLTKQLESHIHRPERILGSTETFVSLFTSTNQKIPLQFELYAVDVKAMWSVCVGETTSDRYGRPWGSIPGPLTQTRCFPVGARSFMVFDAPDLVCWPLTFALKDNLDYNNYLYKVHIEYLLRC